MVGSRLGHVVGKSTVAISNVVSSGLGHFEDRFTVAIRNKVGFWLGHFWVNSLWL